MSLSMNDLVLASTICEIRYEFAYLIFDRTGAICLDCREHYPELKIAQASPAQTSFTVGKYQYTIEQFASRVFLPQARHDPKEFGDETFHFFGTVLRQLKIRVLKRVGLRQVYFKTFPNPNDASDLVKSMRLQKEAFGEVFKFSGSCDEIVLRWESKDLGAFFHLTSVPGTSAMSMADILQIEEGYEEKYKSAIAFDVDYYIMAPVLCTQWDSREWIAQHSHEIRKGIRNFLRQ